jgi:hypothetical protein
LPSLTSNKAVEDAAIAYVIEYEQRHGRVAKDARYRGAPVDVESEGRRIEVKATGTSYRGWPLPVETTQYELAGTDDAFHIYVVENVWQGDSRQFTLRILDAEHVRRLFAKAKPRSNYEVPWPTADYDATPMEPPI